MMVMNYGTKDGMNRGPHISGILMVVQRGLQ